MEPGALAEDLVGIGQRSRVGRLSHRRGCEPSLCKDHRLRGDGRLRIRELAHRSPSLYTTLSLQFGDRAGTLRAPVLSLCVS